MQAASAPDEAPATGAWWRRARNVRAAWLALAAFALGVSVMLLHHPGRLAERGDLAIWDYVAQSILRGQVPYRDVVEIKTPASAYLSAIAMAVGRSAGMQDIAAVRLLQVLLVGLLSAVTFLVAEAYLRNRLAALIAFLIPLLPDHLVVMIAGTQPKLPMILFGMLSLLLIARDKPFWAGLCSMLACLCWQPGLMFTGTAVLICSRYLTSWRDGRALKVMAGALIPLAAMLIYFAAVGALSDLWTWTMTFNASVYAPRQVKGPLSALAFIWKISRQQLGSDIIAVVLSAAGLIGFGVERLRAWRKGGGLASADLFLDALLMPPLIYFAFCVVNFQGGPDLLPLFPFFGIFTAWLVVAISRFLASSQRVSAALSASLITVAPVMASVLLLAILLVRGLTYGGESEVSLEDQRREFQAVAERLEPRDRIYVHGTLEILVLLNRANLSPYIMFDEGKDDFIMARKYGGSFRAFLDELGTAAPEIISLSRLKHVTHGAEFERWVLGRYDVLPVSGYDDIYVRKAE
ncbi:MAG TPA: DolP-mannose mannosyltransferase [Blastocatellia bacterium]|nr:DolP-mannose mannosyltransferase [Blastocatellia bacterium]